MNDGFSAVGRYTIVVGKLLNLLPALTRLWILSTLYFLLMLQVLVK